LAVFSLEPKLFNVTPFINAVSDTNVGVGGKGVIVGALVGVGEDVFAAVNEMGAFVAGTTVEQELNTKI